MTYAFRSACLAALILTASAVPLAAKPPTPPTPPAPSSPPMREVILIRHGHYVADAAIDERIGPGLSTIGVAQARLAGARLAGEVSHPDSLFVSPMQRARDTAASIGLAYPDAAFEVIGDAAECTPPTRRKEIMARETPESAAACKAQLDRLFTQLFEGTASGAGTAVLVAHGNVTRYLVTRALGVDTEAWLEMSVGHASLTRIRIEPDGRYKVIAVGDVGHIPANLRTGASGDSDRSLQVDALRAREAEAATSD